MFHLLRLNFKGKNIFYIQMENTNSNFARFPYRTLTVDSDCMFGLCCSTLKTWEPRFQSQLCNDLSLLAHRRSKHATTMIKSTAIFSAVVQSSYRYIFNKKISHKAVFYYRLNLTILSDIKFWYRDTNIVFLG